MVVEVLSVPLSVVKVNLNDIIDNEYFLEPVFWERNSVQWNVYFGSARDLEERKASFARKILLCQIRESKLFGSDSGLFPTILQRNFAHLDLG